MIKRSIVWKFFELVEQEKDGKKIKSAACNIFADMTLTYVGGTSNLLHHLETKHPSKYNKVKGEDSNESDKSLKQIPLPVYQTMRRCSLVCS